MNAVDEDVHRAQNSQNRDFYFTSENQQQDPVRQLLTEGIATYLSKVVLEIDWATALWADYLESDKQREWMSLCHDDIGGLAQYFLTAMRTNNPASMFIASDPDDIYRYRSGYYLGLAVVETIVSEAGLQPQQLLAYPRNLLERSTEDLLQRPSDLIKSR